jgi:hypothetical protein
MTTVHRKPYSYTRNGKTVHVRATTYERADSKGVQPQPQKKASLGTNLGIIGTGCSLGGTMMSSLPNSVQLVCCAVGIVSILLSFVLRSKGK